MALSTTKRVVWRGVTLDERTHSAMEYLSEQVPQWVQPTQGSFRQSSSYSADTHNGAGAIDISVNGWTRTAETDFIRKARLMGWAAWVRDAIPGLWVRHIHMILIPPSGGVRNDGGLSRGAWSQVLAYYRGRNGLANNGSDNGPRVAIKTFEQWLVSEGVNSLVDDWEEIMGFYKNRTEFEKRIGDIVYEKTNEVIRDREQWLEQRAHDGAKRADGGK